MELACEVLAEYDDAIDELRKLTSETSHDGTKLGSIRARIDVVTLRTELHMALGLLPRDLGALGSIVDGRRAADALMKVLDDHDASDEMIDDMCEALTP